MQQSSNLYEPYISIGIDVGADFSEMSMVLPNHQFIEKKPFRIYHNRLNSLSSVVEKIKKAEEVNSLKVRIFLESTGNYHFPLFCYLKEAGFKVFILNPLITHSSRNFNIRKVHNDKSDSKKIALLGLNPNIKVSIIPNELVLNLRNLVREYYNLTDSRSSIVNKLNTKIRVAFPQYLGIFTELAGVTSLEILKNYTPQSLLSADSDVLIELIRKTSRQGLNRSIEKYQKLIQAAREASQFGHSVESDFFLIKQHIDLIEHYTKQLNALMEQMLTICQVNENEVFIQQVRLLESFKGIGFLSAITLMCEIGDFSAFKKPKQLFAYFGLDPEVRQSGNFQGTNVKISKRGSRLARRVLYMVALQSIGTSNGNPRNPVLRDYYLLKCQSKPKMVALGAIMHKVCNILFAILRDHKPYVMKTPEEHCFNYQTQIKEAA